MPGCFRRLLEKPNNRVEPDLGLHLCGTKAPRISTFALLRGLPVEPAKGSSVTTFDSEDEDAPLPSASTLICLDATELPCNTATVCSASCALDVQKKWAPQKPSTQDLYMQDLSTPNLGVLFWKGMRTIMGPTELSIVTSVTKLTEREPRKHPPASRVPPLLLQPLITPISFELPDATSLAEVWETRKDAYRLIRWRRQRQKSNMLAGMQEKDIVAIAESPCKSRFSSIDSSVGSHAACSLGHPNSRGFQAAREAAQADTCASGE